MSTTQFKLTKLGGLTRRLTLPEQPSWLSLATRIEALYGIPAEKVAVSYVDSDGDEVTLSSQEELLDFYAHCHIKGEPVKFTVIDIGNLRAARDDVGGTGYGAFGGMSGSLGGMGASLGSNGKTRASPGDANGLPNLGPTMVFEVDDWQRVPGLNIFDVRDTASMDDDHAHAYVEVLDSERSISIDRDADEDKVSSVGTATMKSEKAKGKTRVNEAVDEASTASVVDDQPNIKHPVHIQDVGEDRNITPPPVMNSFMPHFSQQTTTADGDIFAARPPGAGLFGSWGQTDSIGSGGFVHVISPTNPFAPHHSDSENARSRSASRSPLPVPAPSGVNGADPAKPLPKTPSSRPASLFTPGPAIARSDPTTPKDAAKDLPQGFIPQSFVPDTPTSLHSDPPLPVMVEDRPPEPPTPAPPCLVNDVANLLGSLSNAFASHPELSEGLRNIVRNATSGDYWTAERQRMAAAADSIRRAATQSSENIARNANELHRQAEDEAGRRVAEALGGLFRTLGEVTSGLSNMSVSGQEPGVIPDPLSTPRPGEPIISNGSRPWFNPVFPGSAFGFPGPHPPPPPPPHPHPHSHPLRPFGRPPPLPSIPHAGRFPPNLFAPPPPPPPPPPMHGPSMSAPQPPPWMYPASALRRDNTWSGASRRFSSGPGFLNAPGGTRSPLDAMAMGNVHADEILAGLNAQEQKASAEDSKVHLEAAKEYYRAEKERFRKEKEERRKARREAEEKRAEEASKRHPGAGLREETVVARFPIGVFPRHTRHESLGHGHHGSRMAEVLSVSPNRPRPGTQARQSVRRPSETEDRITARLSDMDFTTHTYPNIPELIKEHIAPDGTAKEHEDTIVTKVLEALISKKSPSPRPPVASSSRRH